MILTKDDELNLKNADKCHICDKKYFEKDIRVRDHCHVTGNYRGSSLDKLVSNLPSDAFNK